MRRLLLSITILLIAVAPAAAQKGLNINQLFDGRYRANKYATETVITGSQLAPMNLTVYRALTIYRQPMLAEKIEKLVIKDGDKSDSSEVRYNSGRLYYGFYVLKPKDGNNRYILYLNKGTGNSNVITLIYLEGKASPAQVKSMIL